MLAPRRHHKEIKIALVTLGLLALVLVVVFLPFSSAQAATGIVNSIGSGIENILWTLVNVFFGWMVWLGGMLLNTAINSYVIGFGDIYKNSGLGNSIDSLWVIVRDIFNLTFIFGLVAIGLKMIFDSSDSNTRKMLISLIMAALLVNFSLFITKFVVDFANIAAIQLVGAFPQVAGKADVSGAFMQLMGLTTLWKAGTGSGFEFSGLQNGAGLGYILGTMILFIVAAFVFLGGGILLMIRFVVLNLYMVLSPLMFLGMVFPAAANVTKQYWSGFLGRAFFAPAYILMLYFAQKVLSSFSTTTGGKSLSGMFTPGAGDTFESVFPPFLLTTIFLIASLVVAQKMGANGAGAVMSAGKTLANKGRRIVTSTAKGTANVATYLPRAGARMATNKLGEVSQRGLNNLQTKGGWMGKIARTNVVDRKARGAATAAAGAQFGTGTTNQAEKDYKRQTQARANQTAANNQRHAASQAAQGVLNDTTTVRSEAELTAALDALAKTLKDMTKEEKEKLTLAELTDKNIAANLTDNDIENLEKSGKFSTQDIKNIKDARTLGYKSIASHGSTLTTVDPATGNITGYSHSVTNPAGGAPIPAAMDRRSKLAGMGVREVGKLPIDVFKQQDVYAHITPSMLEERMRNGIDPADIPLIRLALEHHLGLLRGVRPSAGGAHLANSPWTKWETGNSNYAAQFFM